MVARSSRIKLSAGQIFWHEAGADRRPVVIFLHGSWHDNLQWSSAIEILSQNFQCLAIDLLGFGNSVALKTPSTIEMEVDCLHEFLTTIKLRRVYLVGHSLGAWIAVSYALKYPDSVTGIVAISPEGFSLNNWKQYHFPTKLVIGNSVLFKVWLKGLNLVTSIADGAISLEKFQTYWRLLEKFPTTCKLLFQRSKREIRRELVADRLDRFNLPFLILQPDTAKQVIIEQSQAYARAVHQAEYKLINGANLTDDRELMPQMVWEISDFLDRVQLQIEQNASLGG
ncbi:alpha/beta hydrolase [Chamaesiphon sp. GL140_3_metabinner_50]|uniref:alpha/beta fold hydrolase n=1 Tax=Chamaesiphon sp. GL140_3_metabinner_50 TaxID=2970812 RepID=UPI0025F32815|nr:alpha/beta hydrolase [Chamaesiphon sp. GL140_3_metabinner_50]